MSKDGSSGAKDYEIKAGSLENQFSSVFNSRAAGTPLLADSRHSVLDVLTPPLISKALITCEKPISPAPDLAKATIDFIAEEAAKF